MSHLRTYLTALLLACVLLGQGLATAHAASFGDTPHEHDGVACSVTVLAEDADELLPPPAAVEPAPLRLVAPAAPFLTDTLVLPPPARAPPPRAPPHTESQT